MKQALISFLVGISLLASFFSPATAFEKKVVLGENFGATW